MRGVFLFRSRCARRKAIGSKQSGQEAKQESRCSAARKNDMRSGSKGMRRAASHLCRGIFSASGLT